MPRISVIIPAYNRPQLLSAAISSVLQQTFQDIEIIIVDDGSREDIESIIPAAKVPIAYHRQPNQGAAAARNLGLTHAHGEFVAFLDSDDLWLPSKLEIQLAAFDRDPRIGLVYSQAAHITADGRLLARKAEGSEQTWLFVPYKELLKKNVVCGGGSSAMLRSIVLQDTGAFDNNICFVEDWDLWLAVAQHNHLFLVSQPLVFYRIHPLGFRTWAPREAQAVSLHENILAVLHKGSLRWPDNFPEEEKQPVLAQAYGREFLRHALVMIALDHKHLGSISWLRAMEYAQTFGENSDYVLQSIINVVKGYASIQPCKEQSTKAHEIVYSICEYSPIPELHLEAQKRQVTARALVELAFLAAQHGDRSLARKHVFQSLAMNPGLVTNLGLMKIVFTGRKELQPILINHV